MPLLNRLLSLLLGLALVLVGVWAIAMSVVDATGATGLPPAYVSVTQAVQTGTRALSQLPLSSPIVLALCVGLLLVGALLLLAEAQPRPPSRVRLDQEPGITWWADRASIERGLSDTLVARTAAASARTRLRSDKSSWHVSIDAAAPAESRAEVDAQARGVLSKLGRSAGAVDLRLRLHQPRRRVA